MPASSIARILNDLDDESAMKIMRGNGERILNYDF
jgi:flagellar motility protein MotE (MotC chaperone)